jgi:hypothetical protein
MRPALASKLGYSNRPNELCRAIAFVFLYLINNMTSPGKVESSISIVDLQKAKPWDLPLKPLGAMKEEMDQFRCIDEKSYILNAATPFVWAWKTISLVLDAATTQKTILTGDNTCAEL